MKKLYLIFHKSMLDDNHVIIVNTDTWNGVVIENYEKATFLRRGSTIHVNKVFVFQSYLKSCITILNKYVHGILKVLIKDIQQKKSKNYRIRK